MKKLILVLTLLCITNLAHADRWRHGGGHYYWHPGYGWAVPAVVGGVIVYEATKPPQTVIIQQPQPNVPMMYPPAAPVFPTPAGYHWEALLDSNCNCYKTVLVPNQ
jgi:hypothetical protein